MATWTIRHAPRRTWPWIAFLTDEYRLSYAGRCAALQEVRTWCRAELGHENTDFARWAQQEFCIYMIDENAALAFKMRWG